MKSRKILIVEDELGTAKDHRAMLETAERTALERLTLAIHGTDSGLWDWYVKTGEISFNECWAKIVGYTLEQLEPISIQTWINLCHPEDMKKSNMEMERHFSGETDFYECECRLKHKNGSWIWVLDRGKVVSWDEKGKPVRMTGTHLDITESKLNEIMVQAERDLGHAWSTATNLEERLETCLRTAIQVSSMDCGGIYVLNGTDGGLVLKVHLGISERFVREVSHYSKDSDNWHWRWVKQGTPIYAKTEELPAEVFHLLMSEGIRSVSLLPLVFDGRVVGCLNIASRSTDHISENIRVSLERIARYASSFISQGLQEEKIRQSERDLDALFNTIQDMLFILDSENRIIHYNKKITEELGYTGEQLIGKSFLFLYPDDRHEEAHEEMALMAQGDRDTCSIPLKTRHGRLIPVETKIAPGHWEGNKVFIGICRNISERLELERELRQTEKAESLNRMTGAIAHHFNNQLQVVIGFLELARLELDQSVEAVQSVTAAMAAADKAADLSIQILTCLGKTPSKRSLLDFSEICRLSFPLIKAAMPGNILLQTDLSVPGPKIFGNLKQLQQMITNLVTNAWEATGKDGGKITISVKTVAAGDIPVLQRFPIEWRPKYDTYACLEVRDHGSGIDEQEIEKLFDPFYSTKFIGRGLGLSIVLGIVKTHDGCVTVESCKQRNREGITVKGGEDGTRPGVKNTVHGGSVFRVFLPLSQKELSTPPRRSFSPAGKIDQPMG
jgi:PAS domain S-box-containing protein